MAQHIHNEKTLNSVRQKAEQTTVDGRPVSSRQSSRCTPSPSILALASRYLVADEDHYDGTCYRSYVYITQSGATGSLTDNEDTENNYDARTGESGI